MGCLHIFSARREQTGWLIVGCVIKCSVFRRSVRSRPLLDSHFWLHIRDRWKSIAMRACVRIWLCDVAYFACDLPRRRFAPVIGGGFGSSDGQPTLLAVEIKLNLTANFCYSFTRQLFREGAAKVCSSLPPSIVNFSFSLPTFRNS